MSFAKAERRDSHILWGIAGPSGSGKTYSALRLATGMANGRPIAFIDTERGRALHYAERFDFLYTELDAPFSPKRYGDKIEEAISVNPAVIIIDSFSHEWAGEGGVLDRQLAEFERLGGRDAVKVASWIKPKAEHKALLNHHVLRLPCHLIVCLRAEDKIEIVDDPDKPGKKKVVAKQTLAGHKGWIPVTGKELPYELTISLVVTPDKPGVPQPIKLIEDHRPLVPLDRPLDESVGTALGAWARGTTSGAESSAPAAAGVPPRTPSASDEPGAPSAPPPDATPSASGSPAAPQQNPTKRQLDKLNVLVGNLRDKSGVISTENLYAALAKSRNVDVDVMIDVLVGAYGTDGRLHWSPLRDSLVRSEASDLIDRLSKLEENAKAGAAA